MSVTPPSPLKLQWWNAQRRSLPITVLQVIPERSVQPVVFQRSTVFEPVPFPVAVNTPPFGSETLGL